jgi:lipid II:glycine glycyltransferase (peptidoglycan interpeptide bridge formation enzyme)
MLIRDIRPEEKEIYNHSVNHPIQSYEWGEFRKKTGQKIERVGFFKDGQLKKAMTITFHDLPLLNKTIGYFPKGFDPDKDQVATLQQLADKHRAICIKLEPAVLKKLDESHDEHKSINFLKNYQVEEGRSLFTPYTFQLDLTLSEEELMSKMTSKTRYNTRLAMKKGVKVFEDSSERGLEDYLKVLNETTSRQEFYAHSPDYFRQMWQIFKDSNIMHILKATYENKVIVTWILFTFNNVLYYPYGASSSQHREVMASNLMMWEAIRFGQQHNCQLFDMWGALGPNPDPKDPWFGFHRFKKSYGGQLIEHIGTYDLVYNYPVYKLYTLAEDWRWKFLRLKKKFIKL